MREYAAGLGYNLSGHRAMTVTSADLKWADVILYMDRGNRERASKVFTMADHAKAKCLGTYAGVSRIPDPAFVKRGPELDRLLGLVVKAAEACGAELAKRLK